MTADGNFWPERLAVALMYVYHLLGLSLLQQCHGRTRRPGPLLKELVDGLRLRDVVRQAKRRLYKDRGMCQTCLSSIESMRLLF